MSHVAVMSEKCTGHCRLICCHLIKFCSFSRMYFQLYFSILFLKCILELFFSSVEKHWSLSANFCTLHFISRMYFQLYFSTVFLKCRRSLVIVSSFVAIRCHLIRGWASLCKAWPKTLKRNFICKKSQTFTVTEKAMMTNKSGEETLSATNLTTDDQLDDQLNSNHTDDII